MKENLYAKTITGMFTAFLVTVFSLNLMTADSIASENENRQLAQEPELTTESLLDGSFMSAYETYLNDQFILRDHWVALKSAMERLIGKQENNTVFFGSQNTLINQIVAPTEENLSKNAGYYQALEENLSVPLYVGLIPSSAEVWADRLPNNAPTADETALIDNFYSQLHSDTTTIPINQALKAHSDEDLYYRTDHHWTSLGAYYGYASIVESMGITPVPLSDYTATQVSDSFFGTTYSTSGVRWVQPDLIHRYVEEDDSIHVTSYFTGAPEDGALYVDKYLEVKDKYSYFLGELQPLCVVKTENTDAPKLLLIRDSYSDCMLPFLTAHFSEIHLVDLRFYNMPMSAYVETNEIDQVVLLYSVYNFISDQNLFKLGV